MAKFICYYCTQPCNLSIGDEYSHPSSCPMSSADAPWRVNTCPTTEDLAKQMTEAQLQAKQAKDDLMSPATVAQLKADMKAVCERMMRLETGPHSEIGKRLQSIEQWSADHERDDIKRFQSHTTKRQDMHISLVASIDKLDKRMDEHEPHTTQPIYQAITRMDDQAAQSVRRITSLERDIAHVTTKRRSLHSHLHDVTNGIKEEVKTLTRRQLDAKGDRLEIRGEIDANTLLIRKVANEKRNDTGKRSYSNQGGEL